MNEREDTPPAARDDPRLGELAAAVLGLDETHVLELVEEALAAGTRSVDIVHAAERGMRGVGERYERQEIYLAGLIMAGEIFRRIMERVQPGLEIELVGDASGTVLLGTAQGDIHDIGKNTVALALRTFGFTVVDLGVNVPAARFVEATAEVKPDIVGVSGLITAAYASMRDIVAALHDLRSETGFPRHIIIGGGTIDDEIAAYIGADSWTGDAMEGVRICQRLVDGQAA